MTAPSSYRLRRSSLRHLAQIRRKPGSFSLFSALRRVECAWAHVPRLGSPKVRAAQEPVRVGQTLSLAFAPSMLAGVEAGAARKPRLMIHGPGLLGPNGALPLHLTELFLDRIRDFGDETPWRFIDMFHHRLLTLFYRAWACAEPTVNRDRPDSDLTGEFVASLIGLGLQSLHRRDVVPDLFKLHFAGRYVHQAPNPEGLRALLGHYFQMAVRIEEFQCQWLILSDDVRWRLGSRSLGALGTGLPIGRRVRDFQHRFKIILGPMKLSEYLDMLPGAPSLGALVALVRGYAGDEYAFEVRLVLAAGEAPRLRLGRSNCLGWTSWLLKGPELRARDDLGVVIDTTAFNKVSAAPGTKRAAGVRAQAAPFSYNITDSQERGT